MEWKNGLTFGEIFRFLGYTLSDPIVAVKVNGTLVPKNERAGYSIPDGGEIEVLNILRGG